VQRTTCCSWRCRSTRDDLSGTCVTARSGGFEAALVWGSNARRERLLEDSARATMPIARIAVRARFMVPTAFREGRHLPAALRVRVPDSTIGSIQEQLQSLGKFTDGSRESGLSTYPNGVVTIRSESTKRAVGTDRSCCMYQRRNIGDRTLNAPPVRQSTAPLPAPCRAARLFDKV